MTGDCPALEQLAALASGDAVTRAAIASHVATCLPCRALLLEQRQIGELARRLPVPALTGAHRQRLAAEVLAQSDREPGFTPGVQLQRRRFASSIAVAAAALAAVVALVVLRAPRTPRVADVAPPRDLAAPGVLHSQSVAREDAPPEPAAPGAAPDRVAVVDGELTIDTRGTRPVEIATPATRVAIADAKVAVVAKRGVIQTVTVIAGTAEVTNYGRTQVIETGTIWERDRAVDAAFDAFRDGWTALRDGSFAAAIAAFDRATDPAVAEDASYWAAVASERAGQTAEARRRFEAFVAAFPESPRGSAARAALARLAK